MGISYKSKGEYDEAIKCYREAIRLKPEDDAAWNNMGSSYDDKGEYDEAIKCYKEALRIKPNKDDVLNGLGWVYFEMLDLEKAQLHFTEACEINKSNESCVMNLAHISFVHGKTAEALTGYISSYNLYKTKDEFWKNYGEDFSAVEKYGITLEAYNEMRKRIEQSV